MTTASDERFSDLFFAHSADLRAFVGALVRTRGAREDVLLEVAQVLWEHIDDYDRSRPFGRWARSVATNKILLHQRMDPAFPARLSPEAILAVAVAWDVAEVRDGVCGRPEEIAALARCLRQLPDRSARLVHQRYAEARPVQSIAAMGNSTPEAVYQSLGRLRQRLAACLAEQLKTEAVSLDPTPPAVP
jgi:RNA polymerase sigma-70 factor (ECF subfamily)